MPAGSYDPLTIPFGVFGRPHGLRGELSLRPFNERATLPAGLVALIVERPAGRESRTLRSVRQASGELLVFIEGVASREQASALTGCVVRLPRHALAPLAPGEYYIEDVPGCRVVDESDRTLGQADGVFWNGAQDVMVVKGDRERLIPLVAGYVVSVDGAARVVRVRWNDDEEEVPQDDGE